MSRGFVKEEDQEEAPFIPPRAALPPGVKNYVTQRGLELLKKEREELEHAMANIEIENDTERRRVHMELEGRLKLLLDRIRTAQLVPKPDGELDVIRFGAAVKLNWNGEEERIYTITGVDEANIEEGRVSFLAPIARGLLGKTVGDSAKIRIGDTEVQVEVMEVNYK